MIRICYVLIESSNNTDNGPATRGGRNADTNGPKFRYGTRCTKQKNKRTNSITEPMESRIFLSLENRKGNAISNMMRLLNGSAILLNFLKTTFSGADARL